MSTVKPNVNTIWSNAGTNIDPGAKYNTGWLDGDIPPAEFFNFILNRDGTFQKHVNQFGVAQWDAVTDYPVNGLVLASDGGVYQSLQTPNVDNDPVSSDGFWVIIASIGTIGSNENLCLNADFNFWQRIDPASPFNMTEQQQYIADRWLSDRGLGGAPAVTIVRKSLTIGEELPDGGSPTYCYTHNQTAVSTDADNPPAMSQLVENVRTSQNRKVTLTFYARLNSGTLVITPFINQNFGDGGSADVTVTADLIVKNVTAEFIKHVVTFDVPPIAGKILGNNNHLEFGLRFNVNEMFSVDIARVKFEQGSASTKFQKLKLADELAECERFFEKSYAIDTVPGTVVDSGSYHSRTGTNLGDKPIFQIKYTTRKRINGDVTFYSPDTGTAGFWANKSTNTDIAILETVANGETSINVRFPNAGEVNEQFAGHYIIDAELYK